MRKILFMKRIILIISFLSCFFVSAQVPQGVSYQAIALNPQGYPVGGTLIGVRLSILENSITGNTIYSETHTTTTNDRGLYNLVIGQGTAVSGQFPLISWGNNFKFLKVELDTAGGSNYVLAGTTQLWSVPYALHAEKANSVEASHIDGLYTYSYVTGFITDNKAYYLINGVVNQPNNWVSQPISGTPVKVKSAYNTVCYLTSTHAYACTLVGENLQPQWFPIQLSGTPLKMINSDDSMAILTTTHAYVFNFNSTASNVSTYQWSSQALSGAPKDIYAFGFSGIGVVTDTNAYGFARTSSATSPEIIGSWNSTTLEGTVIKVSPNYLLFSVFTSTNAYSLGGNTTTGGILSYEWKSVSFEGNFYDSAK